MMTIDEKDQKTLFDRSVYISKEIQAALPSSYLIRPLRRDDDERGFVELLSQLSIVGSITQESFRDRFDLLKQQGSTYIIVIEEDNKIVASATLLVEYKFLRKCGIVGHIEDVVVHDSQRGKKLGIRLIDQLHYIAQAVKCYKTILNCNEKNISFYEKCFLKKTDVQMTRYF
ncbi:glucosamine 6-phosphate N-acetyltransferase [Mucor ambiguus]|uniref:Glucosamine 6-phosphate N-acetyltransferase n=1 Tax=Mucor ambiguus TaxID=91626 RepID=A0A0C9MWE9_9FUNG|nr:glucosamine 6-phosphate N-acetyltransferase [Mucor ambiguus]